MVALLHPGVYVQEIPSGVRSIEGVPTSTTIFVGETERGPLEPTKILSAGDYARLFGGYLRHNGTAAPRRVAMRYATDLFFQNGGTVAYVLRASWDGVTTGTPAPNSAIYRRPPVTAASEGEWGGHIFAVFGANAGRFQVVVYYQAPGTTAPSLAENWDRLSADPTDPNYAGDVLKRSAYVRWIDGSAAPTADSIGDANILELESADLTTAMQLSFTDTPLDHTVDDDRLASLTLPKLNGIDDAAIIVGATERWVNSADAFATGASALTNVGTYYGKLRSYVENRPKQDLFLIADLPQFTDPATGVASARAAVGSASFPTSTFVAVYWPHVLMGDPVGATANAVIPVPPSGAIAGIYARTDAARGVFKAPAGVDATVGSIVDVQRSIIDAQQDDLNPVGVNAVRVIPGAGIVVWGSRTLKPASEWRYVPVRRTAMFLRKSIYNGIQFAVFEPNDQQLWASLRGTITAFMEIQFRNGAFAGATAADAFFVKVDAETTTPDDQAAGIVNILVGFAPLRPAEFVVVKLSQKTATSS